jgi:hypothetical protein
MAIFRGLVHYFHLTPNETGLNVIADKNIGCEVKVVYEPPEESDNLFRSKRNI